MEDRVVIGRESVKLEWDSRVAADVVGIRRVGDRLVEGIIVQPTLPIWLVGDCNAADSGDLRGGFCGSFPSLEIHDQHIGWPLCLSCMTHTLLSSMLVFLMCRCT